ncbi:MAG: hypothetical protein WBE80_15665 [Methylocella sp.]
MNMAIDTEIVSSYGRLAAIIAEHPFGNSDYITGQLHFCLKRRLGKIAAHVAAAGELLAKVTNADTYTRYRILGNTVVRCAIQHLFNQIETGAQHGLPTEQCDEILREAINLIDEGALSAFEHTNSIGPNAYHGRIWCDDEKDRVFSRALPDLVKLNYKTVICTPDTEEVAMLRRGTELLEVLWPQAKSALSHAHCIAIFQPNGQWTSTASSSTFKLSGTIFLARRLISNPWWVAEHLFHEVLHQQLYDFRQAHTLLMPDFDRDGAPRVHSLWNVPFGNNWDVHRALAAFHVYVYLAIFETVAERRAPELEGIYGPVRGAIAGGRKALQRAHYLTEQLKATCWEELGAAGHRFVEFFDSVLDFIDDAPPPPGSFIHLLVDRYRNEARMIDSLLKNESRRADLLQPLAALTEDEVKTARKVLSAVKPDENLTSFNESIATLSREEFGSQFARIRALVAEAILHSSADGFRLSESQIADEILKTMVENSSERLRVLVGA